MTMNDAAASIEVIQRELDRLRAMMPAPLVSAVIVAEPNDWIDTGEAAQIVGLTKSRVTALCRENRIGHKPNGFAKKFGQWRLSRRLFKAWLDSK